MTIFTWPDTATTPQMLPQSMEIRALPLTQAVASPMNGDVTTFGMPGSRWGISTVFRRQSYADRAIVEGYLVAVSGQEHRMKVWDFARPTPRGTINQTGVTVSVAAAQFAQGLTLAGCGNATTLLMGDWLEVTTSQGQQLLMVVSSSTASAGGVMSIPTRPRLRGSVAAGSAVILQKPAALYILDVIDTPMPRDPQGTAPSFGVNWVEVFR